MKFKAYLLAAMMMTVAMLVVASGFTAYAYLTRGRAVDVAQAATTKHAASTSAKIPVVAMGGAASHAKGADGVLALATIDHRCREEIQKTYPDLVGMASISGIHSAADRVDYVRAATQEVWSFECTTGTTNKVSWHQVDGIMEDDDRIGWVVNQDGSMTLYDGTTTVASFSSRPNNGT